MNFVDTEGIDSIDVLSFILILRTSHLNGRYYGPVSVFITFFLKKLCNFDILFIC